MICLSGILVSEGRKARRHYAKLAKIRHPAKYWKTIFKVIKVSNNLNDLNLMTLSQAYLSVPFSAASIIDLSAVT